jgi:hypothetical protein
MKKTKLIVTILLLNSLIAFSQNKLNSSVLTQKLETEDFVAYFPKTEFSIDIKKDQATTSGKGTVSVWSLRGNDENGPYIFQVSKSLLIAETLNDIKKDSNTLNVICNGTMMSFADKLGGKDYEFYHLKNFKFNGQGSIFKVFDGAGILISEAFQVNNYLFMISAGGKNIDKKLVDKFIHSVVIKE